MSRSWIERSRDPRFRLSDEYKEEVNSFLEFAFSHGAIGNQIVCPCKNCINQDWRNRATVYEHLICDGILLNYTTWRYHGESSSSHALGDTMEVGTVETHDDTHTMLNEMRGLGDADGVDRTWEQSGLRTETFESLIGDADKALYPGCAKFTKLSFIIWIFQIKCLCNLTDKALSMVLELFQEALPDGNTLPNSFYETKKIIKSLGLKYKKIDACPNDCMLYWKGAKEDNKCSKCGKSRYTSEEKKIPAKTLRHFPLIPRLQRLYMSSHTASSMRWHKDERTDDQRLRHPADSKAWKEFDKLHPLFSADPRNLRLGLASDGFNPFKTMSINHSTWPVVIIPYNLPPWMCMKPDFFILSLLIPGPKQPGNNIDVYLQPLIEELKKLWDTGVETYDAYKREMFMMHASLLWTINDFPAYGVLSGWSTKGALACSCCNKDTTSRWLKHSRKHCYLGHRRFLPHDHKFRRDKRNFDGQEEHRVRPICITGNDILKQIEGVEFLPFGKRKRRANEKEYYPLSWKKQSIFFELPYWKDNLVPHNLDVMHVEKNVCDNIISTLLDIKGKSKDHVRARKDLKEMNIRKDLHPTFIESKNKWFIPSTWYTMSNNDKDVFCQILKNVKVPDGLCSNISCCVQDRSIQGLKSHDCHILLQQLLPVALRNVLSDNVRVVLLEVCTFFRELCSKIGTMDDFNTLDENVVLTLCKLEKFFPPSFFDIMVHLIIHLAKQASLAGPVQYRWMYPIERFLKRLKDYVKNHGRPEGSIAEGYIADESLTFCIRYFPGIETRLNRPIRKECVPNVDPGSSLFSTLGRLIGKEDMLRLSFTEREHAHRYVLYNYDGLEHYRNVHCQQLRRMLNSSSNPHVLSAKHAKEFPNWFREHILKEREKGTNIPSEIKWLARGPKVEAMSYKEYIFNGNKFHTKKLEKSRKTQNSGVLVKAMTESYASRKDKQPVEGNVLYYGVVQQILQLEYSTDMKIVLFKCDWVDTQKGVEKDKLGFVLVNFNHLMYKGQDLDEPFVLPSQAEKVFYVADSHRENWHVVVRTYSRDAYNMTGEDTNDSGNQSCTESTTQQSVTVVDPQFTLQREMEVLLAEQPEERRDDPEVLETVFKKAMGRDKHGRVRLGGKGCPSASSSETMTELREVRMENTQLKQRLEEVVAGQAQFQQEMYAKFQEFTQQFKSSQQTQDDE